MNVVIVKKVQFNPNDLYFFQIIDLPIDPVNGMIITLHGEQSEKILQIEYTVGYGIVFLHTYPDTDSGLRIGQQDIISKYISGGWIYCHDDIEYEASAKINELLDGDKYV